MVLFSVASLQLQSSRSDRAVNANGGDITMARTKYWSRTLLTVAVVFVLVDVTHGQDERRDGNWWNARTALNKSAYVTGFFDGMERGKTLSQPVVQTGAGGGLDQGQLKEFDVIEARYREKAAKYFGKVTNGQVSDGLDEFYKDFRNRSILIHYAVDVVVRQISGENVDAMVTSLRRLGP